MTPDDATPSGGGDTASVALSIPEGALVRTHDAGEDLNWLGGRLGWLRFLRWVFTWGLAAAVAAWIVVTDVHVAPFVYVIMLAITAAGVAGDRVARWLVRRRMESLARGFSDTRTLSLESDGVQVRLRGRVRAAATVPALLSEDRGVFCRAVVHLTSRQDARLVHERGVDFALVGDDGDHALVVIEGARLLVPDPPTRTVPPAVLDALAGMPPHPLWTRYLDRMIARRDKGKRIGRIRGGEHILRDGDEVWVLGEKSRVLDGSVAHLERQTPLRTVLRGGKELPLLITPVTEAEKRLPKPASPPLLAGRLGDP